MEHQHSVNPSRLLAGRKARSLAALFIFLIVNVVAIVRATAYIRNFLLVVQFLDVVVDLRVVLDTSSWYKRIFTAWRVVARQ